MDNLHSIKKTMSNNFKKGKQKSQNSISKSRKSGSMEQIIVCKRNMLLDVTKMFEENPG